MADRGRGGGAAGAPPRGFVHLHPDFPVRVERYRVYATGGTAEVVVETFGMGAPRVHRDGEEAAQGRCSPEPGVTLPAPAVQPRVERSAGRPFGWLVRAVGR